MVDYSLVVDVTKEVAIDLELPEFHLVSVGLHLIDSWSPVL